MTGALMQMGGAFSDTSTLSVDQIAFDWTVYLVSRGWNSIDPLNVSLTLNADCYSTDVAVYGFNQGGAFPSGSVARLIFGTGKIYGKGGNGGAGTTGVGTAAQNGGPALKLDSAVILTGASEINGGGGGGGGGAGSAGSPPCTGGGGGGGAGKSFGTGGSGNDFIFGNRPGSDGTATTGGAPGAGAVASSPGGAGGNLGADGANGTAFSSNSGGAKGTAGLAVQGYSNGDWSGWSGALHGSTAG